MADDAVVAGVVAFDRCKDPRSYDSEMTAVGSPEKADMAVVVVPRARELPPLL